MITASEIMAGLRGVLAVGVGRADWQETFAPDTEPVFRSFWAIPLAIPFMVLAMEGGRRVQLLAGQSGGALDLSPAGFVAANTLIALFCWGLAMAVLVFLGQRRGIGARVGPLIIVQNWSSFVAYFLLAVGLGLGAAGGVLLSGMVSITVFAVALWIDWGQFRRPLGFDIGGALIGVTAINIFFMGVSDVMMALVLALFLPSA